MADIDETAGASVFGALAESEALTSPRRFKGLRNFFLHKPLGMFGVVVVIILSICAIFAPLISPYNPETKFSVAVSASANPTDCTGAKALTIACLQQSSGTTTKQLVNSPPSASHWLGTDDGARDLLSRVIYGARRSMGVGVISLVIGTVLGTIFGGISGYFGGPFDTTMQRLMDALQALPALVFLLLLVSVTTNPNLVLITVGIGVVSIPQISRIVRSTVIQVRALPYVESAQVVGADDLRVMLKHVLPNIWAPVIVVFTIGVGAGILAEAALSFLGVAPVGISWGIMTAHGEPFMKVAPWEALWGGLAITLAVLGFNLAGDALRDVLDPRLSGRG